MWEEGWLCRASALQMSTGVSLSGVPTSSTTGDFVTAKLSAAVNTAARNQLVVDAWKAIDADKRKSTLVFAADVEHILSLQAAFHESGVRACAVHGKTTADDRAAVLRGFRAGQIEVVVNCGIFTEGTNPSSYICYTGDFCHKLTLTPKPYLNPKALIYRISIP